MVSAQSPPVRVVEGSRREGRGSETRSLAQHRPSPLPHTTRSPSPPGERAPSEEPDLQLRSTETQ